jgi:hypothetical protein
MGCLFPCAFLHSRKESHDIARCTSGVIGVCARRCGHGLDNGGKFLNKNGDLPVEGMPDLQHLSEEGYPIWADTIKDTLKDMLRGGKL